MAPDSLLLLQTTTKTTTALDPTCRRIHHPTNDSLLSSSSSSSSAPLARRTTLSQQQQRYRFPTILTNRPATADCPSTTRHAIVYLTQQRDYPKFLTSMDLLYQNYLSLHHHNSERIDVLLFHTDDDQELTRQHVQELDQRYNSTCTFRFIDLRNTSYWSIPDHIVVPDDHHHHNSTTWLGYPAFGIGYRLMIRFFALTLYDFVRDYAQRPGGCQYEYLLRLDDDSYLLSPIHYNLFDFMENHNYSYAYRMCTYEMENPLVSKQQQKQPSSIWNHLPYPNHPNNNHRIELWDRYQQHVTRCRRTSGHDDPTVRPHSSAVMPTVPSHRTLDRRMCAFYNNFFLAKVDFFVQPHVQDFLRYVDDLGLIFTERLGDLTIQSIAVYAFLPSTQIHRFLDWTYQHFKLHHQQQQQQEQQQHRHGGSTIGKSTIRGKDNTSTTTTSTITTTTITCPVFGALQAGYLDPHAKDTMDQMEKTLSTCPLKWGMMKSYYKYDMTLDDLSPSHAHVPKEYAKRLRLTTIRRATVEVAGMGLLSG